MGVGARDFLIKPFTSDELSSSIHRVHEMGTSRRRAADRVTHEYYEEKLPPPPKVERRLMGKLLMIYSPKGGTGCSMVASNLAIALSKTTRKKVALVDGNLQFGDSDVMLNLQGNRTIADVINRIEDLDSDLMNVMTARHPSGIKVLAAPTTPVATTTAVMMTVGPRPPRPIDAALCCSSCR